MDYDVALKLEKMKAERSNWFHRKTSSKTSFSASFKELTPKVILNLFDSLEK